MNTVYHSEICSRLCSVETGTSQLCLSYVTCQNDINSLDSIQWMNLAASSDGRFQQSLSHSNLVQLLSIKIPPAMSIRHFLGVIMETGFHFSLSSAELCQHSHDPAVERLSAILGLSQSWHRICSQTFSLPLRDHDICYSGKHYFFPRNFSSDFEKAVKNCCLYDKLGETDLTCSTLSFLLTLHTM